MDVRAISRFVRLSPQKARDLVRRMRGMGVTDAIRVAEFSNRKAARLIGKTLKSALANAKKNAKLDVAELTVKQAVIEEGPRIRRYWSRARGGVSPIRRRTCHISIILTNGRQDNAGGEEAE